MISQYVAEKTVSLNPVDFSPIYDDKVFPCVFKSLYGKAFEKGEIDAITSDSTFLSEKAKKSNGKYKMIGKPFTIEPYAVGMRENESNFRDEINFAIQKMVKTGYYDEIYLKWLGQKPSVRPELWT